MAKGKKTGGRNFEKGWRGGPGAPRLPEEFKQTRKLTRVAFEEILHKQIYLTPLEINQIIKSDQTPMIEKIVAKIIGIAFNDGDTRRAEFVLDRLIGKPKEMVDPIIIDHEANKKTFEQFCIDANYPAPYKRQIEMKDFAIADELPRLLLGSRGYGKTDYCTILGVAYDVYLNGPMTSNLIITKSKNRNTSIINEIANALTLNGVELEKENSSCVRIKGLVGKDDSVEVLTIKSSFRGRHPKRIIMDDPVTEEDTSEAMRLLVKKKYDEAYKLCKNIVIIGQPAHKLDLYGELRPMLNKLEIPWGEIPELDADLEAMRLAGIDSRSIEMSYHLRVPSEGTTPFDNIKYIDKFPIGDGSVAFIDPSHQGGDYTALSIVKSYGQGVAVVGFIWKKSWNHCLDDMLPLLKKYNVRKLCIETNGIGDMPVDILRQTFPGLGVVGKRSSTNKHARIMAAGSFAHMIHLARESDPKYIKQTVEYEYNSKFDDAPDSLALCLEWIGLIRGK